MSANVFADILREAPQHTEVFVRCAQRRITELHRELEGASADKFLQIQGRIAELRRIISALGASEQAGL